MQLRLAVNLCLVFPSIAVGQTKATIYFGGAGGINAKAAIGVSANVPLRSRLFVDADLGFVITPGGCLDEVSDTAPCGSYDARLLGLGLSTAAVRSENFSGTFSVDGGVFTRLGSAPDQHSPFAGVGARASLKIGGPVWLGLRGRQIWIRERRYRNSFGDYPSMYIITGEFAIAL